MYVGRDGERRPTATVELTEEPPGGPPPPPAPGLEVELPDVLFDEAPAEGVKALEEERL